MSTLDELQERLIERLRKTGEGELRSREEELYKLKEKYKNVIKSKYEEAVEEFVTLLGDKESTK